jgi:tetratricopeptide (TPR) repeat protein
MDTHNPDQAPPAQELSEPLRQAVEQIKSEPVPHGPMNRAVEKARRQRPALPRPRRWIARRDLVAVACILVMFGCGLAVSQRPIGSSSVQHVDFMGGAVGGHIDVDHFNGGSRLEYGPREGQVTTFGGVGAHDYAPADVLGIWTDRDNDVHWSPNTAYRTVRYQVRTENGWREVEKRVPYTVCKSVMTGGNRYREVAEVELGVETRRVLSLSPVARPSIEGRSERVALMKDLKDIMDRQGRDGIQTELDRYKRLDVLASAHDPRSGDFIKQAADGLPRATTDSSSGGNGTGRSLDFGFPTNAPLADSRLGGIGGPFDAPPNVVTGSPVAGNGTGTSTGLGGLGFKFADGNGGGGFTGTGTSNRFPSIFFAGHYPNVETAAIGRFGPDRGTVLSGGLVQLPPSESAPQASSAEIDRLEQERDEAERSWRRGLQTATLGKNFIPEDELKAAELAWHRATEKVKAKKEELRELDTRKKVARLAESWGKLPERERTKAAQELIRDLPSKYREAVVAYLRQLSAPQKPQDKTSVVWHRDESQPTFARVYIGDGNSLDLVSLDVTVTIDGPRARTVVDHVFRNPHNQQLEGTFEYPLPTGASPSYFAMFLGQTRDTVPARFTPNGDTPLSADALSRLTPAELVKHVDTKDWGKLQEGRIVGQDRAREVYEEVTRQRVDPALLEYAGGNTFRGRVFPIPAKGYNRVVIAYEELLPVTRERQVYRFPLPGRQLTEMHFTLSASAADSLQPYCYPEELTLEKTSDRLICNHTWKRTTPSGDIVFTCLPAEPRVHAISGKAGDKGLHYLYARVRPEVPIEEARKPFSRKAVFVLDTSLSEHPDRFTVSMELLKSILANDPDLEAFNVLTFNAGAAWVSPKGWIENSAVERDKLFKRLDGLVLEGATDLSAALEKLSKPEFDVKAGSPLNVFVLSDGHLTWGETDATTLTARFEQRCPFDCRFFCYRTGLGAENTELYEKLTRKGGGVFQCYGMADVARAARAHRSQCLQVERVRFVSGPKASDVLIGGRRAAVYPDGELIVAGKFDGAGKSKLIVEGTFRGKPVEQIFPIEIGDRSELAPRGWGEIAVESLLALHDPNLDALVTAYCQQFNIGSRVASFLVLETEADYKRFDLDKERGKVMQGDLGKYLADAWTTLGKALPARQTFERFLEQVEPRVKLLSGPEGARIRKLLGLLKDDDFEVPMANLDSALLEKDNADPKYLEARKADGASADVYLNEATRRLENKDVAGAVRVLSSIVELFPGRGDALRLVGYRLLDLGQAAQAVRLFQEVQRQRPFEPHSYRDLARSLERCDRFALAAVQYELVLAGTWHQRFGEALKTVVREEYVHMMQEAINRKAVAGKLADLFGERIENLAGQQKPSDLRVTISWNTDATDVDLWVIEPNGEKCMYNHNRTKNGGELSADQTQGYGPERYQIAKAGTGEYRIVVHYFAANRNLIGGETHVNVVVTRFAGTPREKTERHTVILKAQGREVEVCKVKF